jgi:hypothetical protein
MIHSDLRLRNIVGPSVRSARGLLLIWLALAALLMPGVLPLSLIAQDTATAPAASAPSGASKESAPADSTSSKAISPKPGDVVYLLDQDGRPRAVPAGATLESFLKWLEQQGQPKAPAAADYYVAAVSLEGTVDGERPVVRLDAVLDLVVSTAADVRIPLRLNEATLVGHSHEGPGTLALIPTDRTAGMACRVSGAGQYRLRLRLTVPVRRNAGQQRLQLSLPDSAQSSLRLIIPGAGITVRADERVDLETRAEADQTEVLLNGPGPALDLNWQVAPQRTADRAELQVQTLVSLQVSADEVLADCVLTASSLNGTFDALVFELPPGFQIASLSSSTHPGIKFEEPQFNSTRIQMPAATAGPVELRVKLSAERSSDSAPVLISGLQIKGATRQESLLGMSLAEGYRLADSQPGIGQLQRIGMTSFRRAAESRLGMPAGFGQAWRVPAGTYRAEFQIERIAPSFLVWPSCELIVGETTLDLHAVFEVEVFRGEIDSLRLRWPGFQNQEWEMRTAASPVPFDVAPSSEPDVIDLRLAEPRNRTHGKGRIELQYRRPIVPGDEPFLLSLPDPEVARRGIIRMKVQNADSVESAFEPSGRTVARLASIEADAPGRAGQPENQRARTWDIESPTPQFLVRTNVNVQSLSSETLAVITVSEDRIRVEQTFDYDVAYERLSHVRLNVPPGVTTAQFLLKRPGSAEPVPLSPSGGSFEVDAEREVRLDLPELLWGRFQVLCQYSVPLTAVLSETEAASVQVPLVRTGDAHVVRTRAEVRSPGNVRTSLGGSGSLWNPELALAGAQSWSAEGAERSLPLSLQLAPHKASENFRIPRAALRTRFDHGTMQTQAAYLIEGDISYLTVSFPEGTQLPSVRAWWDGQELQPDYGTSGSREVRLEISARSRSTQHVLALDWLTQSGTPFGPVNRLSLGAPHFASDVWVAETLWDVVLPFDQHILVYPENYMPRFRWRRDAVVWSRKTLDGIGSLRDWLRQPGPGSSSSEVIPVAASTADSEVTESEATDAGPLLPPELLLTHSFNSGYLFSSFGHQEDMTLRSMSQPAIILSGAGLALLVGFVLLRIPVTRHILTFLILGFAMSLAGLWHPEAVALMVQPAICGLLLAIGAALLESRIKRRQQAALVTFSSPSDFMQPAGTPEPAEAPLADMVRLEGSSTHPRAG